MIPDYEVEHSLSSSERVFALCYNDTASVIAYAPDGTAYPAKTEVKAEGEGLRSFGNDSSDDPPQTGCDIVSHIEVFCSWRLQYSRISGGVPVWTRHVTTNYTAYLQATTASIHAQLVHDDFINIGGRGTIRFWQMQGIMPPTSSGWGRTWYSVNNNSSVITFNTTVARADWYQAKFALEFAVSMIHDGDEGVDIPVIGGEMSPRFQCYNVAFPSGIGDQCEFPNGEEAGMF